MEDVKSKIEKLTEHVTEYAETRWDLAILYVTEKLSGVISKLTVFLILGLMGFFTFFFISLSAAQWIGSHYHNMALGHLVVACVYILISVLTYIFRKPLIQSVVINTILKNIKDDENDESDRQS
jgi:predicted branched-subunit amino acid permease